MIKNHFCSDSWSNRKYPLQLLLRLLLKNANSSRSRLLYSGPCTRLVCGRDGRSQKNYSEPDPAPRTKSPNPAPVPVSLQIFDSESSSSSVLISAMLLHTFYIHYTIHIKSDSGCALLPIRAHLWWVESNFFHSYSAPVFRKLTPASGMTLGYTKLIDSYSCFTPVA